MKDEANERSDCDVEWNTSQNKRGIIVAAGDHTAAEGAATPGKTGESPSSAGGGPSIKSWRYQSRQRGGGGGSRRR